MSCNEKGCTNDSWVSVRWYKNHWFPELMPLCREHWEEQKNRKQDELFWKHHNQDWHLQKSVKWAVASGPSEGFRAIDKPKNETIPDQWPPFVDAKIEDPYEDDTVPHADDDFVSKFL